jgi:hypothetical protein
VLCPTAQNTVQAPDNGLLSSKPHHLFKPAVSLLLFEQTCVSLGTAMTMICLLVCGRQNGSLLMDMGTTTVIQYSCDNVAA